MNYKQLTKEERHTIDILFNIKKESISTIAYQLNRSKSTISREIRRNSINGIYFYKCANYKFKLRSKHKYKFRQLNYIEFSKLFKKYYDKRYCGVKATLFKIKKNHPSVSTKSFVWVYKLIKQNNWVITRKDRLRQYYKKGRKRKIGIFTKFNNKRVKPIWTRPKYIDLRMEQGHWEIDLIIGKRANGYANLLTLTERKTRMTFIRKVMSKHPMKINSEIYNLIKENNLDVKTITTDNGIEFEKIGLLAHWVDCDIYFAEPYASWQRGSNEHANGLIRRSYNKGTNFNTISEEEIFKTQQLINNMPREIFGWRSSQQVYK